MSHTPGEWSTWDRGSNLWAISSKDEDHPDWMIRPGTHIVAENITREANAHLIAASPTLLDACTAGLRLLVTHFGDRPDGTYQAVRAIMEEAIAKGRGETP